MFRTVAMILALVALALLVPAIPAAPNDEIKLGVPFPGASGGSKKRFELSTDHNPVECYQCALSVKLKEGQGIDVSVKVKGTGRKVCLKLLDPNGELMAHSKPFEITTNKLTLKEANVSGNYTIVVASDRSGGFELRAEDPDGETKEGTLKEKIKQREEELAELKAKLKALQGGRTKDPE
jgi:hypothetical protein